jgi:hypothetical protein
MREKCHSLPPNWHARWANVFHGISNPGALMKGVIMPDIPSGVTDISDTASPCGPQK